MGASVMVRRRHRPPPVPRRLFRRDRVMRALSAARDADVICLQAPGGYGKTTALAQWVERDPRPAVWLGVRPAAADPLWVAQTLLDAIHAEGLAPEAVPLPGDLNPASWHLVTLPVIEAAIASVAQPFLVVIDDAGAMSGPAWECLVESLAASLPEGAQLALSTRDTVPATLWRLHSRGLVRIIGPDVLAFDEHETGQLMKMLGVGMRPDQVERLVADTEGWPVAVYLAALSGRSRSTGAPTAGPTRITGLDEYLRTDILGRLGVDDAQFLSRVSVLSSLDEGGCDAVASPDGSRARLRRLASVNHLLAPQDASSERFRMHPLLAEFLEADLRERDPQGWRSAHDCASVVEERRGDLDAAVHHAKLAGDDRRLSGLVWTHTVEQLAYGRWAIVQRWLEGVDEQRVRRHRGLSLSAAWVALQSGDTARMNRLALSAAERAADEGSSGLQDVRLLEASIGSGGIAQIEASTREFIATRAADDRWQSLAHFLLGVSLVLRDRSDDGVAALHEGYRRAEALHVPIVMAHCLAALADAAIACGEQHRALAYIRELRVLALRHRMEAVTTTAPIYTTSTVGYVLEGRYADARREAARALRLTALMRGIAPWHAVQGRLALAGVNLTLGDPERAKMLLDEARDARGPSNASPVLERLFEETSDRVSAVSMSLVGASSLTTAEVRVLQYLPTHLSFPRIADELFVSRHTVKTQAMSAYRKLGVHTRTDAIARARQAGLLPRA